MIKFSNGKEVRTPLVLVSVSSTTSARKVVRTVGTFAIVPFSSLRWLSREFSLNQKSRQNLSIMTIHGAAHEASIEFVYTSHLAL